MRDEKGRFIKGHKVLPGTENTRFQKGSQVNVGRKRDTFSEEWIEKMRTNALKNNIGARLPHYKGEESPMWRGGITPINLKIRNSTEYKVWRKAVFKRDNYTCVICGVRGVYLHADHIKPFALYPEYRLIVSNGRTLCVPCHKGTDTYGYRTTKLKS